jgi:hypothetical protein
VDPNGKPIVESVHDVFVEQVTLLQKFKARNKTAMQYLNTVINYQTSPNTKLELEIAKHKFQVASNENRLFELEQLSYYQKKLWDHMTIECRNKLQVYNKGIKKNMLLGLDTIPLVNAIHDMKTASIDAVSPRKRSVPDIIHKTKKMSPKERRKSYKSGALNALNMTDHLSTGIDAFMDRPFPLKSNLGSMSSGSIPQISVYPSIDLIINEEIEPDGKSLTPHPKPPPPNPYQRRTSLDRINLGMRQ